MKLKKMSFANIKGELSADEMRGIMAGSGGSSNGGGIPVGNPYNDAGGYYQLNNVTITYQGNNYFLGSGQNPYGVPNGSGNPSGYGSGGGNSSSGSGGSGTPPHTDPEPYNPNAPVNPFQTLGNIINTYNANALTYQHYSASTLSHSLTSDQQGVLSTDATKVMAALGMAVDSHNFAMTLATNLSKEASEVLSVANKSTGLVGIALGAVTAADDIYKNGGNTGDWIALGLGLASIALMVTPAGATGAAAVEAVSLGVNAVALVNDAMEVAGVYNN